MDIDRFRFGIEIELYNIKRISTANCIASILGPQCKIEEYRSRRGKCYTVNDGERIWRCKCDASLHDDLNAKKPYSQKNICELVTPILTMKDIDNLLAIVDKVVEAGGKCDYDHGCMIHIHVDDKLFTLSELITILIQNYKMYSSLSKRFNFTRDQILDRVKNLPQSFVKYLEEGKVKNYKDLEYAWYKFVSFEPKKKAYNKSRYSVINLHSLFYNKTGVEFRYFKIDKLSSDVIKFLVDFLIRFLKLSLESPEQLPIMILG